MSPCNIPLSLGSKKIRTLSSKANQEDLAYVAQLVAEGKMKSVIENRFSLENTAEAMRYLADGHARAKLVVKVE